MAETYSAGVVTAYGAAVRGGYTGTYEEFCAEQAEFAENAAAVAQAKEDVETMQDQVEQAAATFTGTTVPAAVTTVQEAGAAQVQAVQSEGTMQAAAVETVGAQQTAAVGAAGSDAVDAVEAAETAATDAVTAAQTAAVQAVQAESTTQQAAIQTKGQETIASIPEDYTALSGEVDDLKSALPLKADQTATIRYLGVRISDGDVDGFYTMHAEQNVSESGFVSASGSVFLIPDIGWKSVTMAGAYQVCCCDENGVKTSAIWPRENGNDVYGIPNITIARREDMETTGYIAIYMTATTQLRHFAISTIDAPVPCPRTKQVESESYGRDVVFDYGRIRETENLSPDIDRNLALPNGVSSSNAYCARGFDFIIPKGTRVSTKNTALTCQIMGVTGSGYVFVSEADFDAAGKEYTFENDFFGTIYWRVGSWNVSEGAPTISSIGAFYFVRFVKPDSKWAGKTWYSFGTSISDVGVGDTTGNNGQRGKWPLCVDDFSGMSRVNGAWGSNGIMSNSNLWNAIMSTPYSVDLVTLELGPNDDYWTRLGTVGDTGNDTFLGRLYQIYDYLTKNTRAQVVFVAVGARQFTMDTTDIIPANGTWRNRYRTMVDAVKKLSDLFGIPVIDADANACNLNRRLNGVVMADYIHYTYLGGEMYGRYIWSRLERMEPYPVFNAPT